MPFTALNVQAGQVRVAQPIRFVVFVPSNKAVISEFIDSEQIVLARVLVLDPHVITDLQSLGVSRRRNPLRSAIRNREARGHAKRRGQ